MKSYTQFIREKNEDKISIEDVFKTLKEIFVNDDILSTDYVYEQNGNNGLRVIISLTKLFSKDQVVIYTKFMFDTDEQKKYLTSNTFKYLYEINCQFSEEKTFSDLDDLKNKVNEIITQNKFGDDLIKLSEFIKKPELTINNWFFKNNIDNLSVTGFEYKPKKGNVPCKELDFNFDLKVNENDIIKIKIKKLDVNNFKITFNIFEKTFDVQKNNLSELSQIIAQTLNDSYKK